MSRRTALALVLSAALVPVLGARANPEAQPGAHATPATNQAFASWIQSTSAQAHFSEEARNEAETLVRRYPWAPWPARTDTGLGYRVDAQVAAPPDVCQLTAALVAARLGSTLLDHDVRRPVDVYLSCNNVDARAHWAPPAGGQRGRMESSAAPAGAVANQPLVAAWDYTPVATRPSGFEFEVELLARTPFEENPRRTLDYAAAVREDWFARHRADATKLDCWPALWGGYDRQCVVRFPTLQPRQCAALGLYAGYRDLLKRFADGLSTRHAVEIMAWCGPHRAHVAFARDRHIHVEWFRDGEASSEMSATIARDPWVRLGGEGTQARKAFAAEVEARNRGGANPVDEVLRRAGSVARWFGAETPMDMKAAVDALGGAMRCEAGSIPIACNVATTVAGVKPGPTCRTAVWAAAMVLPLTKGNPLAGQHDFELTVACDGAGRFITLVREHDLVEMVETHPDTSPSDLKASTSSDTVEVWSASLETLREVR
jgi:hypothetical protein